MPFFQNCHVQPGGPRFPLVDFAVILDQVTKRFGEKTALRSVSATLPHGAICGIIGPNGSGKTTTLRMILDILRPDEGTVSVLGHSQPRLANNQISYLPEERGLYRKMKVQHQLEYLGRLKGVSGNELRKRVAFWLERVGLTGVARQKVETLSKGMAQKIQFIGSLLNEPELLILDEPFSGLDPVNMESLREIILELKQRGTSILFSTHDMSMAEVMCDRILMIYEGEKVLDGSLGELQDQFGKDTLRIRTDPPLPQLLPQLYPENGTPVLRDLGRIQELRGIEDPQQLLHRLPNLARVDYFEITPPSLHDMFVRLARPTEQEARETEGGRQ